VASASAHGAADPSRFYPVAGTIIEPRAVGGRAIRCTIAALGSQAIRVAARHADAWNSYGVGGDRDVRGLLPWDRAMEVLAERGATLDAACLKAGRDPGSIGRSYLLAETYGQPLPEPDRFRSMVADLATAGVDEVILYWPSDKADEGRLEELLAIARSA